MQSISANITKVRFELRTEAILINPLRLFNGKFQTVIGYGTWVRWV
jgi:hypothetical protein